MDDVDLANEHNQHFQDAILAMRPRPKPIPEGPGLCLYCLDICPDRGRKRRTPAQLSVTV